MTNGQQEILLDTSLHSVRTAYEQYCQQRITQLQDLFNRLQIQYVPTTADMDLPQLVRQTFPRRSRG